METMKYLEEKKSHKKAIFFIALFIIIGSALIIFALKTEREPEIVGQANSNMQSLIDVEGAQNSETIDKLASKTYKVEDKVIKDSSNQKFIGNITIPVISIDDQKLTDLNSQIEKDYTDLFNTLKGQNKNSENKFTYQVSYNAYDNTIGSIRVLSITIYERIVDNQNKATSYDKVSSYNIDFADNKLLKSSDIIADILGSTCKDKIKQQIKDYVVKNGYMKESEYTYSYTGLENFYIQDSKLHIIFNKGELVNKYVDITIQ